MKKLLSLLFVFTLVACGGSDDVDDANDADDNRIFTERYNGFGYEYIYSEMDDVDYYFISNSANFLTYIETIDGVTNCYEYREGQMTNYGEEFNVSITTNDSARLVISVSYTDSGVDYTDSIEFTMSSDGNTLTVKYDPTDIDTFTKTTATLASLCN